MKNCTNKLLQLSGLFGWLSFVCLLAFVVVGLCWVPGVPASRAVVMLAAGAGFGCVFFFASSVVVGLVMPADEI